MSRTPKTEPSKVRPDILGGLFAGMRSGRSSGTPTTETVEKHFTSGLLAERTDLNENDTGGIVVLERMAEIYGLPELGIEARIWKEHFISRGRMGRLEDVDVVKAKIQRELELAKIDATAAGQSGRERK